jgi:iron complex transport system ATP-binding protein
LDEPTSALDLRHQLIVMELARIYTKEHNVVTIFVVHDLMLASRYGEHLLVLHEGSVYAYDKANRILTSELFADVYGVKGRVIDLEEGYQLVLPLTPCR